MRYLKTFFQLSASAALLAGCAIVQTASDRQHSNGMLFPSIEGEAPPMAEAMPMEAPIASEQLGAPMQDPMNLDPMAADGGAPGGSQRVPLGSLSSPQPQQMSAPPAQQMAQPAPPPAPVAPPTMSPEAAMAMSAAAAEAARQREFRPCTRPSTPPLPRKPRAAPRWRPPRATTA